MDKDFLKTCKIGTVAILMLTMVFAYFGSSTIDAKEFRGFLVVYTIIFGIVYLVREREFDATTLFYINEINMLNTRLGSIRAEMDQYHYRDGDMPIPPDFIGRTVRRPAQTVEPTQQPSGTTLSDELYQQLIERLDQRYLTVERAERTYQKINKLAKIINKKTED